MKSKRLAWSLTFATIALFTLTLAGCSKLNDLLHTHVYDQKDVSFTYLATEADCENSATYYYSCNCGSKATQVLHLPNAIPILRLP